MKKERLTKRLALFTALTLTGAMLAGCGNTDAAESSSDAQTGVTADTQAAAGDASADVVYRTLDEIKESGKSTSVYFPTRIHLAMWMRTESIRDMMSTLQTVWQRISAWM